LAGCREKPKMSTKTRWIRLAAFALVVMALLAFTAVAFAQDGEGDEDETVPAVCNPVAQQLTEMIPDLDCTRFLELQASGIGPGEILKAWKLSQAFTGFQEDWEALLEAKQDGVGWGQFKMAYRLGGADGATDMLQMKQEGYGWGQLRKAQALAAAAGIDFETALNEVTTKTWEEIQAAYPDLPAGPPPWAGGGKDKDNQGPPPWANGGKGTDDGSTAPGLGKNKEGKRTGPPPWSNAGGRQGQDDETQESPDD
ncbi:MAG: hypothetical protein ACWGPS_01605, partial [Candidatus Promineifilaceae bacterium]